MLGDHPGWRGCKVLTVLLWPGGGGEVQHEDLTHSQISISHQRSTGHSSSWTYDIPHTRPGAEWLFLHWWLPSQFPCTLSALSTAALQAGERCTGPWCSVQTVPFIMCSTDCSTAEIISDINHAITSTHHYPTTRPLYSHYSNLVRKHAP